MSSDKYKPRDFENHGAHATPYFGSLGNRQWELLAADIIHFSRNEGKWAPLPYSSAEGRKGKKEMMRSGFLKRTREGYSLTQKALDRIIEVYRYVPPEKKAI